MVTLVVEFSNLVKLYVWKNETSLIPFSRLFTMVTGIGISMKFHIFTMSFWVTSEPAQPIQHWLAKSAVLVGWYRKRPSWKWNLLLILTIYKFWYNYTKIEGVSFFHLLKSKSHKVSNQLYLTQRAVGLNHLNKKYQDVSPFSQLKWS